MSERTYYFVDTSVLLRFLLGDHEEHSPLAIEFFRRVSDSEFDVVVSDSVIFEAVYVMAGNPHRIARPTIALKMIEFLDDPGVHVFGVVDFVRAFALFVDHPKLSFADCAHAVLAMEMPNQSIVAFDEDYLLVGGLTRIMPPGPDTQ